MGYSKHMAELIPVRRVDKNGVLTTRHVRAETLHAAKESSIPAPKVMQQTPTTNEGSSPLRASYPRQERPLHQSQFDVLYSPDKRLTEYLKSRDDGSSWAGLQWEASELENYDVASVVSPDNAVALLKHGVRSAAQARDVLKSSGLELFVDNRALVEKALNSSVSSKEFFECFRANGLYSGASDEFFDAIKRRNAYDLDRYLNGSSFSLKQLIEGDEINSEHVNYIGSGRLHDACDGNGILVEELKKMHSGGAAFSPRDVDEWFDKFKLIDDIQDTTKMALYNLAKRHGSEYVNSMGSDQEAVSIAHIYSRLAEPWGYSVDRERKFIDYVLELATEIPVIEALQLKDEARLLFEAGVSMDDFLRGRKEGFDAQQIVAITQNGIQPSVSSGWL